MSPMIRRLLLVFIGLLLVLTGASLWLSRSMPAPEPEGIAIQGGPQIGGAFTLTDQDGKAVTDADYRGKFTLVFFGFTHCPDICPTTLTTLTNVMNALGDKASQVQPLFITVDPERDNPAVIKQYLTSFHPSVVGLTGTQAQIDAAVAAYRVYAAKQEPAAQEDHSQHGMPSGYMVNHSGFIYLMGKNGEYLTHFSQSDSPETITEALRKYL